MLNTIFIIIIILCVLFLLWLILKKLPLLANINVDNLPEVRTQRQKDLILKKRLQRNTQVLGLKVFELIKPLYEQINFLFKDYYKKLKELEKDIRIKRQKRLTSAVDKSQAVNELITQSKQLINREEYKQAEDCLLDVLALNNHSVEGYKLLAEVYRYRKEYKQAKETLEYLLKLTHNEDSAVYSSLADVAKERGNLKQAEEDYLKSISLAEDNYLHFISLAEVYLELEEKEKSLEVAQKALILSPNNPKVLDFLINISIIMQDKDLSLKYLDKLREVNPENYKIEDFTEKIDKL